MNQNHAGGFFKKNIEVEAVETEKECQVEEEKVDVRVTSDEDFGDDEVEHLEEQAD